MRLSTFSDYSLRVLMHLGSNPGNLITIGEIAALHGISENHLMKVVHQLGRSGYIETVRGKGGGMRLARPATEIGLGNVIRQTENDFKLVECFGADASCRLVPDCRLHGILDTALASMFLVLDGYTLADLVGAPRQESLPVAKTRAETRGVQTLELEPGSN